MVLAWLDRAVLCSLFVLRKPFDLEVMSAAVARWTEAISPPD